MKRSTISSVILLSCFCLAIDVDNDGVDDTVDRCANTPPGVAVDAQVVPQRNLDGDCDVDAQDVALFKACRSGSGVSYAPGCAFADLDGDGDVDQDDYAIFQRAYTGPLSNCSVEVCDGIDNNCNGVVDEGFDLTTVTSCGPGCHPCPGYQQPHDNVTCNTSMACTFSCQGENYDVNNDPTDGCEVADPATGNHTQATATSRGDHPCNDGTTDSFSGQIISDKRVHESPVIVGFNAATGAAPDWWSVNATGGTFCVDDISATLTVSGATSCYRLTIITNKGTFIASTIPGAGTSTATITQGSGSYSDGTVIYFEIEKTCGTNTRENVSYTVNYHL